MGLGQNRYRYRYRYADTHVNLSEEGVQMRMLQRRVYGIGLGKGCRVQHMYVCGRLI